MPVPTHSSDCDTLMYLTKCPDCKDKVYFFACTCGSKTFFDLNRPPWIPHERRCWLYHLRILLEVYRVPEQYVVNIIEEYSKQIEVPIPTDVQERLKRLAKPSRKKLKNNEIEAPNDEKCILTVYGTILNINNQVNFFKRFKISDNSIGRALLKKIVKNSFVEIEIREFPNEKFEANKYIAFMEIEKFKESKLRIGLQVNVTLKVITVPNYSIWVISEYK